MAAEAGFDCHLAKPVDLNELTLFLGERSKQLAADSAARKAGSQAR
jgi:hypothetical protein